MGPVGPWVQQACCRYTIYLCVSVCNCFLNDVAVHNKSLILFISVCVEVLQECRPVAVHTKRYLIIFRRK